MPCETARAYHLPAHSVRRVRWYARRLSPWHGSCHAHTRSPEGRSGMLLLGVSTVRSTTTTEGTCSTTTGTHCHESRSVLTGATPRCVKMILRAETRDHHPHRDPGELTHLDGNTTDTELVVGTRDTVTGSQPNCMQSGWVPRNRYPRVPHHRSVCGVAWC